MLLHSHYRIRLKQHDIDPLENFRSFCYYVETAKLRNEKKMFLKIGFMSTSCKMTTDLVFLFIASSGEKKAEACKIN